MRHEICIPLLLAALFVAQANATEIRESPAKPGSCPLALKPLPRSVPQAVDRIVKSIHPELRRTLLGTRRENLVQFQQDWGAGIRNSLCLFAGNNDQLIRDACEGQLCHPEEASLVIMQSVWDRLQSVKKVMPNYGGDNS